MYNNVSSEREKRKKKHSKYTNDQFRQLCILPPDNNK